MEPPFRSFAFAFLLLAVVIVKKTVVDVFVDEVDNTVDVVGVVAECVDDLLGIVVVIIIAVIVDRNVRQLSLSTCRRRRGTSSMNWSRSCHYGYGTRLLHRCVRAGVLPDARNIDQGSGRRDWRRRRRGKVARELITRVKGCLKNVGLLRRGVEGLLMIGIVGLLMSVVDLLLGVADLLWIIGWCSNLL